jgi:mRNA-degrading endonuclease HigB of HigAB toxin-antitoxin module
MWDREALRGDSHKTIVIAIHYDRQKVFIRYVFTYREYDRWNKGDIMKEADEQKDSR